MEWVRGSQLGRKLQQEVLAAFIYRFTGDHTPTWARSIWKDNLPYPLQFKDDADWLANTLFAITERGTLDNREDYCMSNPTWPENPELRLAA